LTLVWGAECHVNVVVQGGSGVFSDLLPYAVNRPTPNLRESVGGADLRATGSRHQLESGLEHSVHDPGRHGRHPRSGVEG
jgi:hypothetical protein